MAFVNIKVPAGFEYRIALGKLPKVLLSHATVLMSSYHSWPMDWREVSIGVYYTFLGQTDIIGILVGCERGTMAIL